MFCVFFCLFVVCVVWPLICVADSYGGRIPLVAGGTISADLYRFYRSTNEWKLMRAPAARNHGATRLVADQTVHPGPRAFGCVVVDQATKIAYLFAGSDGASRLGEIYSYNSVTNQFTFHSGSVASVVDPTVAVGQSRDGSTLGQFVGSKNEPACWFARGHLVMAGGYATDGTVTQDL